jgi:hypothetical protein
MKSLSLFIIFLSAILLFSSCEKAQKEKAKQTIMQFQTSYKNEDIKNIVKLYPKIITLTEGGFLKSDRFEITNIYFTKEKIVIVESINHWVNPLGADFTKTMRFYLQRKENDYQIIDSKNFIQYSEKTAYKFAVKVGAISPNDTTDIMISNQIEKCSELFQRYKGIISSRLSNAFQIGKWYWKTSEWYNGASGKALVTNTSSYDIPQVKYYITYYNPKNSNIRIDDDGYVCYDTFKAGTTRSFSFYTSYVKNVTKAHIEIKCKDIENLTEELVLKHPFSGTEYERYEKYGFLGV